MDNLKLSTTKDFPTIYKRSFFKHLCFRTLVDIMRQSFLPREIADFPFNSQCDLGSEGQKSLLLFIRLCANLYDQ